MKEELFNLSPSNDIIAYQTGPSSYQTKEGELEIEVSRTDSRVKIDRIGEVSLSFYEAVSQDRTVIIGTTRSLSAGIPLLLIHNFMREDGRAFDVELASTVVSNDLRLSAVTVLDPVNRARKGVATISTVENDLTALGFTPKSQNVKRTLFHGIGPVDEIRDALLPAFLLAIAGGITARARMEMDRIILEARQQRGR